MVYLMATAGMRYIDTNQTKEIFIAIENDYIASNLPFKFTISQMETIDGEHEVNFKQIFFYNYMHLFRIHSIYFIYFCLHNINISSSNLM